MPEREIAGGELWLHPDEVVVAVIPLGRGGNIGLVTSRASGYFYASVLAPSPYRGIVHDVPQWDFTAVVRAICSSTEEAESIIRDAAAWENGHET